MTRIIGVDSSTKDFAFVCLETNNGKEFKLIASEKIILNGTIENKIIDLKDKGEKIINIKSEFPFYCKKYNYVGIIDLLIETNKKLYVVDFKSGSVPNYEREYGQLLLYSNGYSDYDEILRLKEKEFKIMNCNQKVKKIYDPEEKVDIISIHKKLLEVLNNEN